MRKLILVTALMLFSIVAYSDEQKCQKAVEQIIRFFKNPDNYFYAEYLTGSNKVTSLQIPETGEEVTTANDMIATIGITVRKMQLFLPPNFDLLILSNNLLPPVGGEVDIPLSTEVVVFLRYTIHKTKLLDMIVDQVSGSKGYYCDKVTTVYSQPSFSRELDLCCLYDHKKKRTVRYQEQASEALREVTRHQVPERSRWDYVAF